MRNLYAKKCKLCAQIKLSAMSPIAHAIPNRIESLFVTAPAAAIVCTHLASHSMTPNNRRGFLREFDCPDFSQSFHHRVR